MDESIENDFDETVEPKYETTCEEIILEETVLSDSVGTEGAKFINEFRISVLLFRHQQVEPSSNYYEIRSNSLDEFRENLYLLVQPFIKREIEFKEYNQACWSEREFPSIDDLTRFVAFKDKLRKRVHRLEQVSEKMLLKWNKRQHDTILQIFTHSCNLDSRAAWDIATESLFNDGTDKDDSKKFSKESYNKQKLKSFVRRLQKRHHTYLRPKTDDAYTLWAQMLMETQNPRQKQHYFNKLPSKLLEYFEDKEEMNNRKRKRKKNVSLGPAQRGQSRDGYSFEDEVSALRQTVIQIKDLVEMLDRRVELLEEKCHGFRPKADREPIRMPARHASDDNDNDDDEDDDDVMGEENDEPTVDVSSILEVDHDQEDNSGNPDPLLAMACVKEEYDECESGG